MKHATESVGGSLEGFYFAFRDTDPYVIAGLPGNEAATAVALAVDGSDGAVVQTVVLLTAEEVDAAAKKNVDFRPPGS